MDSIPGWIFCIIGWDFFYYWLHRLSHEVNILWASHVIHHHSEEYNLIVALRQTSTGGLISWIFFLPLALIGFPPWMFLAAGQINLIYQYWVHTKAIRSLGSVAEFWLSTPSHHRVHHAINPEYIDKNHGGILIIWDRIFGSFQKEEKEPVYGTVKPFRNYNPLWANLHYYWEIFLLSYRARGIGNKLKVFFMPPGWIPPGEEGEAHFLPIPEVDVNTFEKYNPVPDGSLKTYVLIWFLGILFSSFGFLVFLPQFSFDMKVVVAISVMFSLIPLNALLESRSYGLALETIRLLSTPVSLYILSQNLPLTIGVGLISVLSIPLIWILVKRQRVEPGFN